MSGIKARLMKPTGLEWFDGSFKIAAEVWKFICHEYKNKAADQSKSKGERTRADIPKRYWETKINVYGKGDYKWLKRQLASARTRRIVLPACA